MGTMQSRWCKILEIFGIFIIGTLFGILVVSKVPESLAFASQVISAIVWPILILTIIIMFQYSIRELLKRDISFEAKLFKLVIKTARLEKEAAGIQPAPASAPSAKQRIIDQWRIIHNKIAEVYKNSTQKAPPSAYKPLANRLKQEGILTNSKVWELVDTSRSIYRKTKKASESQVNPDLADYYESLVPRVLSTIEKAKS